MASHKLKTTSLCRVLNAPYSARAADLSHKCDEFRFKILKDLVICVSVIGIDQIDSMNWLGISHIYYTDSWLHLNLSYLTSIRTKMCYNGSRPGGMRQCSSCCCNIQLLPRVVSPASLLHLLKAAKKLMVVETHPTPQCQGCFRRHGKETKAARASPKETIATIKL